MAYGFTATAGTIVGSHVGFVGLFTADNFPAGALSGPNALINGGGNLRAYTDSTKTTPLPIEVVTLVTGVSPLAQVWSRLNALESGGSVYLEADDTETTQPPVDNAIGRNSVWQDFIEVYHFQNDGTDSTGNGLDLTLAAGNTLVEGAIEKGVTIDGEPLSAAISAIADYPISLQCWVAQNPINSAPGSVMSVNDGSGSAFYLYNYIDNARFGAGYDRGPFTSANGTLDPVAQIHYKLDTVLTSNNLAYALNGTEEEVNTSLTGGLPSDLSIIRIGAYRVNSSPLVDAVVSEVRIANIEITSGRRELEFNNQKSPGTFWTSSAWEEQGGSSPALQDLLLNTYEASATFPSLALKLSQSLELQSFIASVVLPNIDIDVQQLVVVDPYSPSAEFPNIEFGSANSISLNTFVATSTFDSIDLVSPLTITLDEHQTVAGFNNIQLSLANSDGQESKLIIKPLIAPLIH